MKRDFSTSSKWQSSSPLFPHSSSLFAFTLVELIVVITILAILGTVAFVSFSGYQSGARDSVRLADLANISQSLEISLTKTWYYPAPSSSTGITFSGGVVWTQWTIGDSVIRSFDAAGTRISKKPTDPKYPTVEYTYSLLNTGKEYQIAGAIEDQNTAYAPVPLIPTVYAVSSVNNPLYGYIKGNYNGVAAKVTVGSPTITYVLALPTIILRDTSTLSGTKLDSGDILQKTNLVLHKKPNVPNSYTNNPETPYQVANTGTLATFTPLASWSLLTIGSWLVAYASSALPTDATGVTTLMTSLQSIYSTSELKSDTISASTIASLVSATGSALTDLGTNILKNSLGGVAINIPTTGGNTGGTSGSYQPNAVKFDGANDYLMRGGALSWVSDSSQGILSFWVRGDQIGAMEAILHETTGYVIAKLNWGNTFQLALGNASLGTGIFSISASTTVDSSQKWYHILASWDTNAAAGSKLKNLYINDTSNIGVVTDTQGAFNINYTQTDWAVGSVVGGTSKFNGAIADLYFAPGQYLDFSQIANRRKFIDANGQPMSLGVDGSLPTGTKPAIFLNGNKSTFATNAGSGGSFTLNGALETASTTPTTPSVNAVKFDGAGDYLSKASALSNITDGSQGLFSAWVRLDSSSNGQGFLWYSGAKIMIDYGSTVANAFTITVRNAASTSSFSFSSAANKISEPGFYHILAAWDTNFPAGSKKGQIYVNWISDIGTITDSNAAFNISYSLTPWQIGTYNTTGYLNGSLSELYFAPGQYLDLSIQTNREKFIKNGQPVNLGVDGSTPTGVAPAIYLNKRAALFGQNLGTGGDFTVNGAPKDANSTPMYYYSEPTLSTWNTTNYLSRGALTGASNTGAGTESFWLRADGTIQGELFGTTNRIRTFFSAGYLYINITGAGGGFLQFRSATTFSNSPTWVHVLASWNTNMAAGSKVANLYINNISSVVVSSDSSSAFLDVPYATESNWYFGNGSMSFLGAISDLYLSNRFIDISQASNRAKFIDQTTLRPVFLGKDGSLPDGQVPLIYLANPYSSVQNNLGTGGNFTVNGTLTRGTTSASDVMTP